MEYSLVIDPGVEFQLKDLEEFHESQQSGRGSDFLEVVWDCLEQITSNPKQWQFLVTKQERIRQAIILYQIHNDLIIVTDVYDSRSDWMTT